MDWIAIYQESATALDRYLDFHFVQGEQNPLHNAVPVGNVTFDSILPAGQYVYRYLVNRQFASVMSVSVSITSGGPTKSEAEQIFDGLAKGLGVAGFDFEKCVEDGNLTVQTFKQAFIAFEDRHIFDALRLIGQGLDDFRQALHDCNETTIAQKMEQFIKGVFGAWGEVVGLGPGILTEPSFLSTPKRPDRVHNVGLRKLYHRHAEGDYGALRARV